MNKKTLGLFLTGTLFFFCSCVDETYDLANQEITTDVELKGNKLSLPLGSLKAIMLDSLLGSIDLIGTTTDDIFAIRKNDTIHPIEKTIDEILLEITPQSINTNIPTAEHIPNNIPELEGINIPIPFDQTNDFSFKNEISNQFQRIESFTFKEEMAIKMNIKLNGLEALEKSSVNLDFTLEFPPFFKDLRYDEGNDVTVSGGNKVHITKGYSLLNNEGLSIELLCSELDFTETGNKKDGLIPTSEEDGKSYLSYQGEIKASGNLQLGVNPSESSSISQIQEIGIDINCAFEPSYVHTFNGIFYDDFESIKNSFPINLGDQLEALKKEGNHITLSEPQIEVILYNSISMPTDVALEIIGKDKEGNVIESAHIKPQEKINIDPAIYDPIKDTIYVKQSKLILTATPISVPEGVQNIAIPELADLLECVPDSITLNLLPIINKETSHHINIYQTLSINAAYDVVIPLKFKELEIHYSDTISVGLGGLDAFGDFDLKLKMDVANTIPLELELNIAALDSANRLIEDIKITSISIQPGNGESLNPNVEKQELSLDLDANGSDLDKLRLDIAAKTDDETMGLKGAQGLHISGIVIEASGDVGSKDNE